MPAKALTDRDYLEGRFTVDDLMMLDVLRIEGHTGPVDEYSMLKAYRKCGESRPGFQRALAMQLDNSRQTA